MSVTLKIFILLLQYYQTNSVSSKNAVQLGLGSLELEIEDDFEKSKNFKRSPLEMGFVSFELKQHHGRNVDIPAIVRQNIFVKDIPLVPKSGTVPVLSVEKGPKADHVLIPLHEERVILPAIHKIQVIHPKVIVEHKEILVDHAAKVVLDEKHILLEQPEQKTVILEHKPLVLHQPVEHTIVLQHKPLILEQDKNKIEILDRKPTILEHPRHKIVTVHPKTVVLDASKSISISPKSRIHEIIVHRQGPKVLVHPVIPKNVFRSHFGGFGVGIDYGGHGAGHGFYVPIE